MRRKLRYRLFPCWFMLLGFAPTLSPNQSGTLQLYVQRKEIISRNEVHFTLNIANYSGTPLFLTGIPLGPEPKPAPVYLEHQGKAGSWNVVVPCMDIPPPDVLRLDPGQVYLQKLELRVPLEGACKVHDIMLEGKFRFRIKYFKSEKQARAYIKLFLSKGDDDGLGMNLLSEPFEIKHNS